MREHDPDLALLIKRACPKGSGARIDLTSSLGPVRGKIPRARMGLLPSKGIKIVRGEQFGIYLLKYWKSPKSSRRVCCHPPRQCWEGFFCHIQSAEASQSKWIAQVGVRNPPAGPGELSECGENAPFVACVNLGVCVKYDDEAESRSSLLHSVTARRLAERRRERERERERCGKHVKRVTARLCSTWNKILLAHPGYATRGRLTTGQPSVTDWHATFPPLKSLRSTSWVGDSAS